jgi:activator of HSP90 ATPase
MYQEDERWIVKDMGNEGRNVNKWHWEEKNIMNWTKTTLENLFNEMEIKNEGVQFQISKVDSIKGESVITQRKG